MTYRFKESHYINIHQKYQRFLLKPSQSYHVVLQLHFTRSKQHLCLIVIFAGTENKLSLDATRKYPLMTRRSALGTQAEGERRYARVTNTHSRARHARTWVSGLVKKWATIAPNGTNLGLFNISFLFVLFGNIKLNLNYPRFVQFGANLWEEDAKSDIPEIGVCR